MSYYDQDPGPETKEIVAISFWAVVVFLLLWLSACTTGCTPNTPVEEPKWTDYDDIVFRVVQIRNTCNQGDGTALIFAGSGVILDNHRIVTAIHVVECALFSKLDVVDLSGNTYTVERDASYPEIDVAILHSKEPTGRSKVSIGVLPYPGDYICAAVGVPQPKVTCGTVSPFIRRPPGDLSFSMPIVRGNSGSGIYFGNRLIGIVTHGNLVSYGGRGSSLGGILQ